MNLEIIQNGRVLRTIQHNGSLYAETPESGEYEIRLTNSCPARRIAVVSVDGINVTDGADASHDGSGFVLSPWQSVTLKGFLRNSTECARFTFSASSASYAAQTGRGVKNTGVIGVAVFDEKPAPLTWPVVKEVHHHHHQWPRPPFTPGGPYYGTAAPNTSPDTLHSGVTRGFTPECSVNSSHAVNPVGAAGAAIDVGTAYGRADTFHTTTTTFQRASTSPALVLTMRYGTTAKLREWGVPVDAPAPPTVPNAFPASAPGYAPAPAGWRG